MIFLYSIGTKIFALHKNISVLLENMPLIQKFSGTITIHAQKSINDKKRSTKSLANHKKLFNSISIVVPCHNEEMNVTSLIDSLRKYYNDYTT